MPFSLDHKIIVHDHPIYALTVGENKWYTGAADKIIKRTDSQTFSLDAFAIHTSHACMCLHYTPANHLLIGLLNGDFHAIDAQSKKEIFSYSFPNDGVFSIASCTSFTYYYVGLASGTLAIFDAATFELLYLEKIAQDKIRKLKFCPQDRNLYVASKDGTVRIFDPLQFSCIDTWTAHSEGVNALVFGPDDTIITGGKDGYIRSWKRSGTTELLHEFPAHRGVIYDLLVCGKFLISASRDKSIKIWELPTFAPVKKLTDHRQSVNALAQQNDHSFVSVSDDATLISWIAD